MKNDKEAIGLMIGEGNTATKDICRLLAKEGITALVKQKEASTPEVDDMPKQWSGQPGKDLFFNGWKLLF
ncbi:MULTISPECIES: hypothetical protein [Spirosoma]|uniref:Uncharacterized protein n=1 Tax=Spirosoma liriopis TaxID=2937440 RepID=A0ABT0HMS4_9BACT|nr:MULTISPECIES: hypothetical protein [Spirosoma]MCK8492953.1 hypothetical protein [Spirosoma liriopis]UHG92354.1 hypothetical protein LQ777_05485 [Spirosoma oryzicola]